MAFFDFPVGNVRTLRRFERNGHALGVNAGIGAAAALDLHPFGIEETRKFGFDDLLNGDAVGLTLPAVIGGAVETDFHAEIADWTFVGHSMGHSS